MDMGNGCRKKENDFLGFTRKILVESTEMCYDTSVGKIHAQIWFIGRTLASQAGETGSIPAICFFIAMKYLRVNTNPYCSGMKNAISIDYKEVDKTIGIPCKRCTNKNIL